LACPSGLIYPPNAFADVDELGEGRESRGRAGSTASHLRYDGLKLRDGIEEAIAIGERAGIPVHVFHIKVTGQKNFGRMKEVIELVERPARVAFGSRPINIRTSRAAASLTATIPPWAQDAAARS
jgi:dihydroorotase/N-acyl-D-amino-acid deacylase